MTFVWSFQNIDKKKKKKKSEIEQLGPKISSSSQPKVDQIAIETHTCTTKSNGGGELDHVECLEAKSSYMV